MVLFLSRLRSHKEPGIHFYKKEHRIHLVPWASNDSAF
jgi:hypothetical protein